MTGHLCSCGEPTAGAWLCDHCAKTLAWAILNIMIYFIDLTTTVATKRTRFSISTTRGSVGKSQPLVVDMRFTSTRTALTLDNTGQVTDDDTGSAGARLQYDTWDTIVAWTRTIMEAQPQITGPVHTDCLDRTCSQIRRRRWPRVTTTNTVPSMCHYLARQHHWILSQHWAPQLLDELLNLEHRLSRFVDRPADRWYAGKCSTIIDGIVCTADLYATVERGTTECRVCGTMHDVATRREFLLREAEDNLVTATEAAGALLAWTDYDGSETKLVDRIRKWRDRDQLEVQDVISLLGRDRHLYRLGDIQALLLVDAQEDKLRRLTQGA
jgi:hypothetical protein